jgi:hypothetical protein
MMRPGDITWFCRATAARLRRLPFVLALTLGLLLSLVHCAGDVAFAKFDVATTIGNDSGTAPDQPDQLLPAHSGHCLSHVTAQGAEAMTSPAAVPPRAPGFGRAQVPPACSGLPLFKPPRA